MSSAASGKEKKAKMTDSKPAEDRHEKEPEEWYDRTLYQFLVFAVGIVVFVIVGALVLNWYIDPRTSTQKQALVQALGLITAGTAGAVGIFFTWRAQRLARKAQEETQKNTLTQLENAQEQLNLTRKSQEQYQESTQAQLENAQAELRVTRQGQITERFTQAIDQLGSKSLDIRLGGIYSLERTAREDRDFHWPIMEILTAYVREHAPWKLDEASIEKEVEEEHPPEADIQAILTVIGRRERYLGHGEHEPLDLLGTNLRHSSALSEAHLERALLRKANLHGANLQHAHLQNAQLQKAYLYEADLYEADLREADLTNANLQHADFQSAQLQHANLANAYLRNANLLVADLQEADLPLAQLQGANLHGANLQHAHLQNAQLQDASLHRATLQKADLQGANLLGANLQKAYLQEANLQEADLQEADLRRAYLMGANLLGANLSDGQLEEAIGDQDTQISDHLKRPAHWGVKTDEQPEED